MAIWYNRKCANGGKCAPTVAGQQWQDFRPESPAMPLGISPAIADPQSLKEVKMPKWPSPVKKLKSEIAAPIQQIAMVAVAAFVIAALALFIAIGKGSNASA